MHCSLLPLKYCIMLLKVVKYTGEIISSAKLPVIMSLCTMSSLYSTLTPTQPPKNNIRTYRYASQTNIRSQDERYEVLFYICFTEKARDRLWLLSKFFHQVRSTRCCPSAQPSECKARTKKLALL